MSWHSFSAPQGLWTMSLYDSGIAWLLKEIIQICSFYSITDINNGTTIGIQRQILYDDLHVSENVGKNFTTHSVWQDKSDNTTTKFASSANVEIKILIKSSVKHKTLPMHLIALYVTKYKSPPIQCWTQKYSNCIQK